jgi:hypothetical protein
MVGATVTSGDEKRRRRAKGLLRAAPGLVAPVVLLAVCIRWFVQEAQGYYALPFAQRTADGDPFSADAGMFVAGVGIAIALLLLAPPLLAGLPVRLRVWQVIVALAVQSLPLWVAATSIATALGRLELVGLAYVPALVVARLVLRRPIVAPPSSVGEGNS